MPERYGASPESWRRWSSLGLTADMLPVVSNPHARISGRSTMKGLGKTPSLYNSEREVVGLAKWTERVSTEADVERWAKEPDYGIAIQTRRLRAIDIDVEEELQADVVRALLSQHFTYATRIRAGSGKCLVPFWMEDGELPKHVIPVAGGLIEILGDGQQFIAEGTWIDSKTGEAGERYQWIGSPEAIPRLDAVDFAMLLAELKTIATDEVKVARQKRKLNGSSSLVTDDDVAAWLLENWETYDEGQDGQIFIKCPFEAEHSSDTGPSSTAYFPAGTGGYSQGNFVCLHAHCTGRDQAEFLNATGFVAGAFNDLADPMVEPGGGSRNVSETSLGVSQDRRGQSEDDSGGQPADPDRGSALSKRENRRDLIEQERFPRLTRDSNGRIEPTMNNLLLGLASPPFLGRHIGWDEFKDMLVVADADQPFHEAQWVPFRDTDYALVRQKLEVRGFKPMGAEMLRLAILAVAEANSFDTAAEWLKRLTWDGEPRLDIFCHKGWGWTDTPYARAVGRYTWTALAGRVMEPGTQADMVPILVGPQGALKTSSIKAMAPHPDFYASIALDAHDADTSRLLRGTLVAELEELRGFRSREIEAIKAWLSKTHEKWVPKYREFTSTYGRRNLFFGTTNEKEILADPTGERRSLPGETTRCNPDWIVKHRDQLWAEGAATFALDGVDWLEAESLARIEHGAFKVSDPWEPYVSHWLREGALDVGGGKPCDEEHLTTADILSVFFHIPSAFQYLAKQIRIGSIMKDLGWHRKRVPIGESRVWAYTRSE